MNRADIWSAGCRAGEGQVKALQSRRKASIVKGDLIPALGQIFTCSANVVVRSGCAHDNRNRLV